MKVKPFCGYRYNSQVTGDAGACIAPPYDVIDPDQQEKLYAQHEYNIVRVTKGKKFDSDTDNNNVYTRAADYINDFIAKGALKLDTKEAVYVYS